MKRTTSLFLAAATATGVAASLATSSLGRDDKNQAGMGMPAQKTANDTDTSKEIYVTTIPRGYRDWKFVSTAHEAGDLNDIRVSIANDKAIEAYRAGKPFPEGSIIGRVAWKLVPSDANNKLFGKVQSYVPGEKPDWYLQFMVKDTRKYAATGGWGYSNFGADLKPSTDAKTMSTCFACHKAIADRDYIFTKYEP